MAIPLPGGGEITDWDADTIGVTAPSGAKLRVARAAAPLEMQAAVQAADAPPAPTTQQAPGVIPPDPAYNSLLTAPAHAAPPTIERPQLNAPAPVTPPHRGGGPVAQVAPPAPAEGAADLGAPGMSPEQALEAERARLAAGFMASGGASGAGGSSRTTTSRTSYDPATVDAANELQTSADVASEDVAMAQQEGAEAEAKGLGEISEFAGQQAQKLDAMGRQQAADQQDYARRYAAEENKLKSLQVEADSKIDPKRWWKEKSTGENILAALAMGLGAMGASLTGGQNYALQMIDKAIERDIDSQLSNRDSKYKQVAAQQDVIGLVRNQFADKRQERDAARLLMQESAAKYVEQSTARSTSEVTRSKGAAMAAEIRQQSAKGAQALLLQLAGQTTTQKTTASGSGGGGGAANKQAQAQQAASEALFGKYDPEALIVGAERVFGVPMQATGGKEDAKALNKLVASGGNLLRTLDQMDALSRGKSLSPSARTSMDSLRAQALLQYKDLAEAGALDAGLQGVVEDALGPKGTDITTVTNALPGLKSNIRAGLRTNLGARAVRVDPQRVPLAHRQRFAPSGQSAANAPPPTRALAETD